MRFFPPRPEQGIEAEQTLAGRRLVAAGHKTVQHQRKRGIGDLGAVFQGKSKVLEIRLPRFLRMLQENVMQQAGPFQRARGGCIGMITVNVGLTQHGGYPFWGVAAPVGLF